MIDRYSRPEMSALWTQEQKFATWLEVELAVCEAWTRLGVIDARSMAEIRDRSRVDAARILEIEEETR
ncbi:MAG: adenylosuccinate lyase, partial [Desulfovibrio sp.]|nr:adenylosuccinate lyase [Desulfovibrio sp.]MDR1490350.1 adenylosuccinate lyase [Desulfovibrio sp.]